MRIPIQKAMERQTDILFSNIQALVDIYPDYEAENGDWDYGAQLFHLVTSLDKWFIDPDGERGNVVEMLRRAHHRIPAADMASYFKDICERIREFIRSNPDWESSPGEMEWSHLELVMGQFRHAMHHVGYLHAYLRIKGVKPPEWIGLSQAGKHARSA